MPTLRILVFLSDLFANITSHGSGLLLFLKHLAPRNLRRRYWVKQRYASYSKISGHGKCSSVPVADPATKQLKYGRVDSSSAHGCANSMLSSVSSFYVFLCSSLGCALRPLCQRLIYLSVFPFSCRSIHPAIHFIHTHTCACSSLGLT